jgi:hypothetical protein
MIRDQIRLARSVALDQAADLVATLAKKTLIHRHRTDCAEIVKHLREAETKIREMK